MLPDIYEVAYRESMALYRDNNKATIFANTCKIIEENNILNDINKLFKDEVLTPLTLNNDEFTDLLNNDLYKNYKQNIRYPYILKSPIGKIINTNAYHILIRAMYSHDEKKQLEYESKKFNSQVRVYISKGGVITGEYIENCIIKDELTNHGKFFITSVPYIPVAMIKRKDETFYVVDHREPKIKLLKVAYDVPIYMDENVQKYHMNLRTYQKLKIE